MNIFKLPIFAESWNVAYRIRQEGAPLEHSETPFTVIKNPFRYWAADPFLFEYGDNTYIFAELYDYILRRGVIGYYQLNAKKSRWIPIIKEKHHLSYPFIYMLDGKIYILPEANESETLYRYRAVHFPDQWVREKPLLNKIRFADTTPLPEYDYQLAMTYDLLDQTLKLIDLEQKTVISASFDEEGIKRPAGYSAHKLPIRAAQDCREDYGKGIILYRYEIKNRKQYTEKIIRSINPNSVILSDKLFIDGIHTYNQSRQFEVIDIKTRRFNILNFVMRSYNAISKKIRH